MASKIFENTEERNIWTSAVRLNQDLARDQYRKREVYVGVTIFNIQYLKFAAMSGGATPEDYKLLKYAVFLNQAVYII
jgi:hypothetical protein